MGETGPVENLSRVERPRCAMRKFIAALIALIIIISPALTSCGDDSLGVSTDPGGADKPVDDLPVDKPGDDYPALPYRSDVTLFPITTGNKYNLALGTLIFDTFFILDEELTPQVRLIESYTYSEGNRTYSFTLKKGVTFHDGSPLTSADAVYTINLVRDTPSGAYYNRLVDVSSCVATGDHTFEVALKVQNGNFPALLDIPVVRDAGDGDPSMVGTGRFSLRTVGGGYVLDPNSGWAFREEPETLRGIVLKDIGSTENIPKYFEQGELDAVFYSTDDVGVFSIKNARNSYTYPTTRLTFVGINLGRSLTSSPGIRRAISAAVDRDLLTGSVASNYAAAAVSVLSPFWKHFDGSAVTTGYDRERAISILEGMNYTEVGEDGVRRRSSSTGTGSRLSIEILVSADNTVKKNLAESVAVMLRDVGFEAVVNSVSYSDYVQSVQRGSYDLYIGEVKITPDMDVSPLVGSGGSANYGKFPSFAIDDAISGLKSAVGDDEKRSAASTLISTIDEIVPVVPLYYSTATVMSSQNLKVNPAGWSPYNGIGMR